MSKDSPYYIVHKDNTGQVWSMKTEGKEAYEGGEWDDPNSKDGISLFLSREYAEEYCPPDGVVQRFPIELLLKQGKVPTRVPTKNDTKS